MPNTRAHTRTRTHACTRANTEAHTHTHCTVSFVHAPRKISLYIHGGLIPGPTHASSHLKVPMSVLALYGMTQYLQ